MNEVVRLILNTIHEVISIIKEQISLWAAGLNHNLEIEE